MKTTELSLANWQFTFPEGGLSASEEIEHLAEECKLFRPPTIIFGKNACIIRDTLSGTVLAYNAREALRFLNYAAREEGFVGAEK